MITLHPEQLYRTLELEGEEFSNEENAERHVYNIQQIILFKEAVAAEAIAPFAWKPIATAPFNPERKIIVARIIDGVVQWVSHAYWRDTGWDDGGEYALSPSHWMMEV